MHPILFSIGGYPIYTYGALVGIGMLGGLVGAVVLGHKEGLSADYLWDIALLIIAGTLIGSRLEYVRTHWDVFSANPAKILAIRDGGLVFYGGLIGSISLVYLYMRFRKMPALKVFDIYGSLVPIGHAVGRLGCLAAGCCYGRPTDLPWGITFPEGSEAPAGIALHPTQLYESAYNLGLGIFLQVLLTMRREGRLVEGSVFGVFLIGYAIARFCNEFFRGDGERGIAFWGLTNAQATAMGMAIIGITILVSRAFSRLKPVQ